LPRLIMIFMPTINGLIPVRITPTAAELLISITRKQASRKSVKSTPTQKRS